jgi:hypothetical protein
MTEQKWTTPTPTPTAPAKPKRWFMWTFLAVQVIFILWITIGIDNAKNAGENCIGLDAQTCHDAATTGAVIGFSLVLAIWAAVDIILGITYAIIRANRRSRT